MKVLVVKPHLPIPPTQGTRRVTLGLLRDLATTCDVSYLCMLETRGEARLVPELERMGVSVRAPLTPNRRSPLHRIWYRALNDASALVTGYPRDYYYATPRVLGAELERWTREEAFDVVVLEYWKLARLLPRVRSGRPVVLAHDAEFVKRAREEQVRRRNGGGGLAAWRLGRESKREVETLRRCETILALTERDRRDFLEALGDGFRGEIRVLPVGFELPAVPEPAGSAFEKVAGSVSGRVGFLGSFKADFNLDALRYLLSEIWPAVRARKDSAELLVAGGELPAELRARGGVNGVRFLGYVEDLARFLGELGALVVPLRFGGGLRIRLVEALSVGVPVVATPVAVAGLDLIPGTHYLEGRDRAGLADAIVRVLEDAGLRDRLSDAGRRLAQERYDRQTTRRRTVELFRELGSGRGAAQRMGIGR